MNGRQCMQIFTGVDNLSGRHNVIGCGREQWKLYRSSEREIEGAATQFHNLAFLLAAWNQAERLGRFAPFSFQSDVERMSGAASDASSRSAPDHAVPCGTARHSEFERLVLEHSYAGTARPPTRDHFHQS